MHHQSIHVNNVTKNSCTGVNYETMSIRTGKEKHFHAHPANVRAQDSPQPGLEMHTCKENTVMYKNTIVGIAISKARTKLL